MIRLHLGLIPRGGDLLFAGIGARGSHQRRARLRGPIAEGVTGGVRRAPVSRTGLAEHIVAKPGYTG